MDLNWIKFRGYKRLISSTLKTPGKVVAIVGPNEAGKSSILSALQHINHAGAFSTQELTHNQNFQGKDIVLEAGFLLDESDREALSELYQGDRVRQFRLAKQVSGNKHYSIQPELQRDPKYFIDLIDSLQKSINDIRESLLVKDSLEVEKSEGDEKNLFELENLLKELEADTEVPCSQLISIANRIRVLLVATLEKSKLCSNAIKNVDLFVESARTQPPNKLAIEILKNRVPKVLLFDNNQRNLLSQYNLSQCSTSPSPALRNLANVAKLDLVELNDAISSKDRAKAKTLIQRANREIAAFSIGKWSQSGVKICLDRNGSILEIFIENDQDFFTNYNERSEGLRQFIALINFLEAEHAIEKKPILLIDEAEIHLHYDAQADLIDIFSKQELASKIIYTTHSSGCLPEDLGTGVRAVVPALESETSEINNWFWQGNRPGFSPLLLSMGANNLAFVPIRKAVFVEGATDMLLLPTILRQVIQKDFLGFQIAPGLSVATQSELSLLENEAPKVAFLVDNDGGGQELEKQLKEAGISSSRIFRLPGLEGTVLEDCIDKDLYLEAVNSELVKWNQALEPPLLLPHDLGNCNHPKSLKDWCREKNLQSPDKRVVAYRLLEFATDERQRNLIRSDLRSAFESLYEDIVTALNT